MTPLTGGRAVVEALVAAGVTHAFCVPGESFLGLLDALYDDPRIRTVAARHEGGASFMAEAFGKLTGRPAACMGTRMVGAGNLAIGIHTARHDSTPLIALVGQVSTDARYREAFQEAEIARVFAPVAKWAVEPPRADRLGELVLRAGREARFGRPGPVVVSLREDLLQAHVPASAPSPLEVPRPAPDRAAVRRTLDLLRHAERPLLLVGGGVLAAKASDACVRLAERLQLPAMAVWRRQDAFPNDHPLFLGQTGLAAPPCVARRLREADLVLAVGTRLSENATHGYTLPGAGTRLVHVDVAAEGLGAHLGAADVACVADAGLFVEALLAEVEVAPPSPDELLMREVRNVVDRAEWEAETTPSRGSARAGYVDQQVVAAYLRGALPRDAILTTDAGNFAGWPARYLRWNRPGTFLGPTSGAMGYGVPAAISAKLARPDRTVLSLVGDGGFLMTGAEIETSVRESAPFIGLVYDNGQYGTIRMHQQGAYPGRQMATALGPVDAALFARSLGGHGISVRDDGEFPAAFDEALRTVTEKPVILHLRVDPEQISVGRDAD